jgi:hypothetical protein
MGRGGFQSGILGRRNCIYLSRDFLLSVGRAERLQRCARAHDQSREIVKPCVRRTSIVTVTSWFAKRGGESASRFTAQTSRNRDAARPPERAAQFAQQSGGIASDPRAALTTYCILLKPIVIARGFSR